MSVSLNDRIAEYLDVARNHLDAYVEGRDPEDLHQMRLSLKRVRALAWVVDQATGTRTIRRKLSPWIRLFRQSGHVRDLEVQCKLLNGLEAPPSLILEWEAALQQARDDFSEVIRQESGSRDKRITAIRKQRASPDARQIRRIFCRLWDDVLGDLDPADSPDWHENRKRIKRLIYLDHELPGLFRLPPFISYSIGRRMDDLQDSIGKWHDVLVILERMGEQYMNVPERDFVRNVLIPRMALLAQRVQRDMEAWKVLAKSFRP